MKLDRADREALTKIGGYVVLCALVCFALLAAALVLGEAVHLFRLLAGV